jgi:hypothetical protein
MASVGSLEVEECIKSEYALEKSKQQDKIIRDDRNEPDIRSKSIRSDGSHPRILTEPDIEL